MLSTANDIILLALRAVGVVNKYQPMNADDGNTALQLLNAMIAAWAADNLMQEAQGMIVWSPVAGTPSYTIGQGQTINVIKPYRVNSYSIIDAQNNGYDASVVTREEYFAYQDRLTAVAPPEHLFYDQGSTQSTTKVGTIYLHPVPDSATTYTITMQCDIPFAQFAGLMSAYNFDDYYQEALWSNLAVRCAAVIARATVPKEVVVIADKSYKNICRLNSKPVISGIEIPKMGGRGGGYNIYTDS